MERKFDANDRRIRMIHLTESGQAFIQKIFNQHKADMEKAVSGLDKEKRQELLLLLKKLGKEALEHLASVIKKEKHTMSAQKTKIKLLPYSDRKKNMP